MSISTLSHPLLVRAALALAALVACAAPTQAQVLLSGNVFDGSGGPLVSGTVYHADSITVPAGETLTVQAGAIVKFQNARRWTVNGTLAVDGIAGDRAFVTSIQDDSAGGDTNANGPSSGTPGDWQGILVGGAGVLDIEHASIRFAGASGLAPVFVTSTGSITVRDSVLSDSSGPGMDLNSTTIPVVVENCTLDGNGNYPIQEAHIDALGSFLDNTASGNGSGDIIQVTSTSPTASLTIDRSRLINDCLYLRTSSAVPAGTTLTLAEGVVVKWSGKYRLTANGNIVIDGTPAEPVVFTSEDDDDYLGDTTKNGPTAGAPGDWQGILVAASGSLTVDNAILRYGGSSGISPVFNAGGSISLVDSVLRDASGVGVDMNTSTAPVTISGCTIQDNGGIALSEVHIDSVTSFSNNTASGNGGDHIELTNPSPSASMSLSLDNLLGEVLVVRTSAAIPSGATLTLPPGIVWKWTGNYRMTCNGALVAKGTRANPIVFTSDEDDEYAGDTNGNGPSNGSPGDWQGILVAASGSLELLDAVVRYGGGSGLAPVFASGGSIDVRRCLLSEGAGPGIDMNSVPGPVTIVANRIEDNALVAIAEVAADSIPGFSNNSATGNGGDYMRVSVPSPTADLEIAKHNLLGDVVVATTNLSVPAGVTLRVKEGVAFKWTSTARFTVNGTVELLGTGFEPVVFTSFEDDSVLGDTNGDGGATLPAPGDWQGFLLNTTATGSRFEHMVVRYAGASGIPGVWSQAPTTRLRSVRVDHCGNDGFRLNAGAAYKNLIAFGGTQDGIELLGGSTDLLHATVTGNAGTGVRYVAPYTGRIHNTISWSNGTGNYDGVVAGSMTWSDGDSALAGSDGNLNVDPMFVDPSTGVGDLRLASGSPVIDAANTTYALMVKRDHTEHSRSLDPTLSGNLRPDMGAHEAWLWELVLLDGVPRLGSAMRFQVDGPAGTSTFMLGTQTGGAYLPPYGFLTCGVGNALVLGTRPVGQPLRIAVPRQPSLVGTGFCVQALVTPNDTTSNGAYSNLYRACLLPRLKDGRKLQAAGPIIQGMVEGALPNQVYRHTHGRTATRTPGGSIPCVWR